MKKPRLAAPCLLLGLCLLLAGCAFWGPQHTLVVTVRHWNGWEPENAPNDHVHTYAAGPGFSTRVPDGFIEDDLYIRVTTTDANSLTFKTGVAMAPKAGQGYDMVGHQTKFTVKKGETLEMMTLTMDAGTTFSFELKAE